MRLQGNGNVGIGTTSPSQKLHIMSGSVLAEGGGTNNGVIIGSHTNNVGGAIYGKGITNQIMYFDSTNTILNGESNIYFRIANSDKVTINSSGNIGIGTTGNINYKLIANGGIGIGNGWGTSGATLEMTTDNVGSGGANLSVSYWGSSSYGPLTFSTSNSIRMTIKGDGNFDYGGLNVQSSNNSVYRQAFWGAMSIMWRNAEDAYIDSNHTYSSSNTNVASYTSGNGIGRLGIYGGFLEWGSYDGSVSAGTAYTLSSKFIITKAGNVGIGTTSPADKLEIYEGSIRLHKNHIIDNSATWLANINFTDEVDRLGARITGERTAWDGAPMGLGFDTGGVGTVTRRMTITSGGNVGIGTTSPSELLHINSSVGGRIIRASGPSNTDNYISVFSGGIEMIMDADYTNSSGIVGTQSNHSLILRTNGTNKVWVNSSGNVGIGTSSPSTALQVNKNGANGSGGLGDFNIVATSTSSAGSYQATIGAMNIEAGGYANLNLGDSDGVEGTRYFWHISKRLPNATDLGAGGRNLSYYWYNGSGFVIQFAFSTGGSFYAAADIVAYASSDIRLKDNVVKIESPLEKLMKLNGYSFTWNDKQTTYEAGKKDLGVIAQEVEQVFPEIVKDRENGTKGVMYDKLVPVLIEAIKEQQQQIDELKYLLQTINK
jgi:hypothetical protein